MAEAVADLERCAERRHPSERKPAQLQPEQDDEEQAEPEGRRREERERGAGHDVVEDRVLPHRGENTDRDREEQHHDEDRPHEVKRVGQSLADQREHGLMARERVTPIKSEEATEPRHVLDRQRAIETESVLETHAVRFGEVRVPFVCRERSAWCRLQDREGRDADRKEERQRLQQPAHDVATHSAAAPLDLFRYFFRYQSATFQVNRCHTLGCQPCSSVRRASMFARSYIQMITYASLSSLIAVEYAALRFSRSRVAPASSIALSASGFLKRV